MTHNCAKHPTPRRACKVLCGCACDACNSADRRYHKLRRHTGPRTTLAIGTHRRIQALVACGWTFSALARHLDRSPYAVRAILSHDRVRLDTARRIIALYDQLWDTPPPNNRTANLARNHAARHGWPVPLAWDDDTIDDPTAKPYKPRNGVLGLKGSLVENVEWLADAGEKLPAIARDLGITQDSIKAALWRANRRDLVARIMPEPNDRHHQNQHTKGRAA